MKNKLMIISGLILIANGARAESALLRSLSNNIYQAQAIERQELQRYNNAKASYQASKNKVKSAIAMYKQAKLDEIKEDQQLRAIERANAALYEIPNYKYNAGDTDIRLVR